MRLTASLLLGPAGMGFQLLNVLAAKDLGVLTHSAFDSEGVSWALDMQSRDVARMWTAAPAEVLRILSTENVTVNLHHDGVTPETFANTAALTSTYRCAAPRAPDGVPRQCARGHGSPV